MKLEFTKSIRNIFSSKVRVKNASNTTDEDQNWLEYYFSEKYHLKPFTSMKCPSCNKTMYLKRVQEDVDNKDIMVGGHVTWLKESTYILPICKECNDKKENLSPFEVEYDKLCPLKK